MTIVEMFAVVKTCEISIYFVLFNSHFQGQNMISKKYLLLNVINSVTEPSRKCVSDCDADGGYKLFFNRCIRFDPLLRERAPQGFLDELWQDVESFSTNVLWLCLLGFFNSLVVLALLWYIPRALIWTLVFGTIVVCVAGTGWFWIKWHLEDGESRWLYFALGSTLMCVLVGIFLAAVWKKVTLMVQLLHESGLALKSMVLLVFLPVLTIFIMIAMLGVSVYLGLMIESCGKATMVGSSVHYVKDSIIVLARWYNFLALIWFYHFLLGCQHVMTAGAITQWYFTREDDRLQNVQGRSFTMLVRYHLGTVALGSFLLAILLLFQWLLKILRLMTRKSRANRTRCCCVYCCQCCVGCLQSLLDPVSRKAYIVTALHGQPFFTAGKKVIKIYGENSGQMLAIDVIGSIIFILSQLSVLVLVGFIGVKMIQTHGELYHPYALLAIVLMVVYLITHCCMLMYKV
ncbi:AAEL003867-PA [Aedes aegypti]|uniref:Choline transporter-like protein n=1 Tax=Aedes aegypti TaxID=7159 RepID=Q17E89_AEDAE|nr:AAEL003867-PA [Aedes aegypti]